MGIFDVTQDQFRECAKSFSEHNRQLMTMFRHMSKKEQDDFLNKLEMDTLHVRTYLQDIIKYHEELNKSQVANRYGKQKLTEVAE